MSDTRSGLLKAIHANLDDDLPRLVFADWLDENGGDWWADYIRKMIADRIGRIEYGGWESGNPFGYDFGWHDTPSQRAVLVAHRGFVCEVRCSLDQWLQHGPAVVAAHPVERVEVTDREPSGSAGDEGQRFGWWNAGDRGYNPNDPLAPAGLLRAVWELLDGYHVFAGPPNVIKWYPTREAAMNALSAALIGWAKLQPVEVRA